MILNTVLAVVSVLRLKQRLLGELTRLISPRLKVLLLMGQGAGIWQLCAIVESAVFLWVAYPTTLLPFLGAFGFVCLLLYALALRIERGADTSQPLYYSMAAIVLAVGTLNETELFRHAAAPGWEYWLLICGSGILILDAGLSLAIEWRRRRMNDVHPEPMARGRHR
jgi:uncharacterized membrane protein YhaH (DUF805 family)